MADENRAEKLANRLKELRLNAPKGRISANKFGEKIGYSQSYISALENNHKKMIPSKEVLNKLSSAYADLGYDHKEILNELLELAGYEDNVKYVDSFFDLFTETPTLNGFNEKSDGGIVAYKSFNFPINDLYFHLTDDINKKMFKTVILSDYDREYIIKMIETYLLHKLKNRKGDYSKSIDALTKKDFQFPNMNKEGD